MPSQTIVYLIIGIAVLCLLIYRQVVARPVGQNQRVLVILLAVGLIEAVQNISKLHAGMVAVIALAGSLVLAAAFGTARAVTVRIWLEGGQAWSRGNLMTAALWVTALGAHLGYDYLIGQHKDIGSLAEATIVLYLAVSLAVQRVIVTVRAQRLGVISHGQMGGTAP